MTRNVTLKLDENPLKKSRRRAVAEEESLCRWVCGLMSQAVSRDARYAEAKRRALKRLASGFHLGGRPLSREEAHER